MPSSTKQSTLVKSLTVTYAVLTCIKVVQWATLRLEKWKTNRTAKLEREKLLKPQGTRYTPSTQAIITVLNTFYQERVEKIPRKDFRNVTDVWLESYNNKLKDREPKSFDSLDDALKDFFKEFCNETSTLLVTWIKNTQFAFLRTPLGLTSSLELMLYPALAPFFLAREYLMGGNQYTLMCKTAASATINELYVTSCKEELSYEEVLHDYPWVSGAFVGKQLHPMIGRSVCPVYKREVIFPKDKMNFEYEFVDCPSGASFLRQKRNTWLGNMYEDTPLLLFPVLGALALVAHSDGVEGIGTVTVPGFFFYAVRNLVDKDLGVEWHSKFKYLP